MLTKTILLLCITLGLAAGESQELHPSGVAAGDELGAAVARSGRWVLAGAPGRDQDRGALATWLRAEDGPAIDPGTDWFTPGEVVAQDRFGAAVSTFMGVTAVGAPGTTVAGEVGAGAVYLLRWADDHWEVTQRITAPAPAAGAGFGSTIDLFKGIALAVGSPGSSGLAGTVDVYAGSDGTFHHTQHLAGSAGGPGDAYGHALDLYEGYLAVGAPESDAGDGRVYLYETKSHLGAFALGFTMDGYAAGNSWANQATRGSRFGSSITYRYRWNQVVVGAPLNDFTTDGTTYDEAGLVYWLKGYDGGALEVIAVGFHPEARSGQHLGAAMTEELGVLWVGAPDDDTGAPGAGSVISFSGIHPTLPQVFRLAQPVAGGRLGAAVAATNHSEELFTSLYHDDYLAGAPGAGVIRSSHSPYLDRSVYRNTIVGDCQAPTAVVGEPCVFDISGSLINPESEYDWERSFVGFAMGTEWVFWDFHALRMETTYAHTFTEPGYYLVTVLPGATREYIDTHGDLQLSTATTPVSLVVHVVEACAARTVTLTLTGHEGPLVDRLGVVSPSGDSQLTDETGTMAFPGLHPLLEYAFTFPDGLSAAN